MKKRRELLIEQNDEVYFRIEKFVEEVTDEYLLHDTYFGNILIALTEAVQNAIIHGNKADASKKVLVTLEQKKEGLWIAVADQGDGFDFDKAMAAESLFEVTEKQGLALIRRIADEVRFKHHGRVIEMLFRIYGIDENIFDRRQDLMREFMRKIQHQELERN
jgi:serine/threonine-protein kinase RsbW